MIRTFRQHNIRPQQELTGKLWDFTPLQGNFSGKTFPVHTPSCWESYPGFGLYRGEGRYETQFEGAGNLRIECKGVSHTATIALDGKTIAGHYNAYTAFSAIVKQVEAGTHTLTITADNRFSAKSALHVPNDYMSYGGVSRPVVLENVRDSFIEYVHVTPSHGSGTWLLVREGAPFDDLIDRFGFREITVEGKRILLNGSPVKIKGLCRHEDHPQFGCALPFSAIANDLALIRDLGANSVRTSHYPNDEIFLDLCDELGILVWEENHARGLSPEQMQNPFFEKQAHDVTLEMVTQHYNHPSIYIWGILNECASDSAYGKTCYEKLFELIRSLDKSRPLSFASCKFKTDLCFGLPDIVSYNIYPKWYHDTPVEEYLSDLYSWIQNQTEGAGKPFLVTEIGAGGLYGYRSPYATKWSEEFQAKTLQEQLDSVLSFEDCSGVYVWQFCDIRISEEWWGGRPRTMNNKGVVDEYRRPKLCYETVKELFAKY